MAAASSRSLRLGSVLFLLLAFHPAVSISCEGIDPPELIPESGACPGWDRDGETMTAYTLEELYAIIDGGAALYGQYGFVAAAFQNYAGEILGAPTYATLMLANQGTAANAQALYEDPGSGTGDPIPDWPGTGAARVRVDLVSVTLQFWQDCFYCTLTVGSTEEGALSAARCLAERTCLAIQGATAVRDCDWGLIRAAYR